MFAPWKEVGTNAAPRRDINRKQTAQYQPSRDTCQRKGNPKQPIISDQTIRHAGAKPRTKDRFSPQSPGSPQYHSGCDPAERGQVELLKRRYRQQRPAECRNEKPKSPGAGG